MHEMAIAQSLLEIIEGEMASWPSSRLKEVKLRIGVLSGVVPEALEFAFQVASQGTVAEGALLRIERVPFRVRCESCKGTFEEDLPFMVCPRCGGEVEILSGRELEIESMEIEDGSQSRKEDP